MRHFLGVSLRSTPDESATFNALQLACCASTPTERLTQTLAAVAQRARSGEDFHRAVREFLDEFALRGDERSRADAIVEKPLSIGEPRQDAYLGALAEHLAVTWNRAAGLVGGGRSLPVSLLVRQRGSRFSRDLDSPGASGFPAPQRVRARGCAALPPPRRRCWRSRSSLIGLGRTRLTCVCWPASWAWKAQTKFSRSPSTPMAIASIRPPVSSSNRSSSRGSFLRSHFAPLGPPVWHSVFFGGL